MSLPPLTHRCRSWAAGIIATPREAGGLVVVVATPLDAIAWNIITRRFGLPAASPVPALRDLGLHRHNNYGKPRQAIGG
ncbi:hypothetical protein [Nonomuraea sp. NPDC003709]|uniref:hypothetical protein n=1 Tax=Nonomuraea sp. NPDC003709 TaxID=3154450 RepID=UPI0033AEC64D